MKNCANCDFNLDELTEEGLLDIIKLKHKDVYFCNEECAGNFINDIKYAVENNIPKCDFCNRPLHQGQHYVKFDVHKTCDEECMRHLVEGLFETAIITKEDIKKMKKEALDELLHM
jgi:hypothetical protein